MKMAQRFVFLLVPLLVLSCQDHTEESNYADVSTNVDTITHDDEPITSLNVPYVIVLGEAQDAGFPQAGCQKSCCEAHWNGQEPARKVVSLGIVDPESKTYWMFEATPDFRSQLQTLQALEPEMELGGIFVTHAHIGHYTGLMQLGHEVMGADSIPVWCLPRMSDFLSTNGPWSQLVNFGNIALQEMTSGQAVSLTSQIDVTAFTVPHRDEYSETAGFRISGPGGDSWFIPDVNKWQQWKMPLDSLLNTSQRMYLDATFYADGELPGRDMSLVPHPFVSETMALLQEESAENRAKVNFIHFNHTNPLLIETSEATKEVINAGYNIAREGNVDEL